MSEFQLKSRNYHNLIIGRYGEDIAKRYLSKRGYRIIGQNYWTKYGEIDLITRRKQTLIFVEVKAKIGEKFGIPEDGLSKRKLNRIARACLFYLNHKGYQDYRIDAICIVFDRNIKPQRINHYCDINLY